MMAQGRMGVSKRPELDISVCSFGPDEQKVGFLADLYNDATLSAKKPSIQDIVA